MYAKVSVGFLRPSVFHCVGTMKTVGMCRYVLVWACILKNVYVSVGITVLSLGLLLVIRPHATKQPLQYTPDTVFQPRHNQIPLTAPHSIVPTVTPSSHQSQTHPHWQPNILATPGALTCLATAINWARMLCRYCRYVHVLVGMCLYITIYVHKHISFKQIRPLLCFEKNPYLLVCDCIVGIFRYV